MAFFSKKKKIDYNVVFKEKYKYVNKVSIEAHNELDYVIKQSLWENVVAGYQELIELINQGADQDKQYFISLLNNAEKELEMVKKINESV